MTDKKPMLRQNIWIALKHISNYKCLLVLNLVVLMFATLFESFGIGMLMPILQSISSNEKSNFFIEFTKSFFAMTNIPYNFLNLVIIFTMVMLIKYFLVGLQQYLSRVLSATMIRELRDKTFRNLMEVPLSFFYKSKVGNLIATIFTSTNNAGGMIEYVMMLIKGFIFTIGYVTLCFIISIPLTAIIITTSLLSYFLIFPRFKAVYRQGIEEKSLTDEISSFLHDSLSGIKIIKTFSNEKKHIINYSGLIEKYKNIQIKIMINKILASFLLEPLAFIMLILVLVYSVKSLSMSVVSLVVFLYIFTQIIPKMKMINSNYMQINELLPHFAKVQEIINGDNKYYLPKGNKQIDNFHRNIKFMNVSFRYPGGNEDVLKDINIKIDKTTTSALVGMSGGGKTTLIDLLLRHHDPCRGSILIDDVDLKDINTFEWHKLIGVVDQDPYLFNDTIYNNILYGKIEAEVEEVYNAAKMSHVHGFVSKLPDKYQTIVGNRGMKLSGGQKQRISLARALIRNPEILILDEATSSLDSESEELIQKSIENLQKAKTVIIIAHRLSTIRNANKIIVIENGEVVEEGDHRTLIQMEGRYKDYITLQTQTS